MNADITLTNECVKSVQNIGSTTYINICHGGQSIVPWGSSDWFSLIFTICLVFGISLWMFFLMRGI